MAKRKLTPAQALIRYRANKEGKTIAQIEREDRETLRCDFCGAHGHKASKCPAKTQS